jgi:hypothetical protein
LILGRWNEDLGFGYLKMGIEDEDLSTQN